MLFLPFFSTQISHVQRTRWMEMQTVCVCKGGIHGKYSWLTLGHELNCIFLTEPNPSLRVWWPASTLYSISCLNLQLCLYSVFLEWLLTVKNYGLTCQSAKADPRSDPSGTDGSRLGPCQF